MPWAKNMRRFGCPPAYCRPYAGSAADAHHLVDIGLPATAAAYHNPYHSASLVTSLRVPVGHAPHYPYSYGGMQTAGTGTIIAGTVSGTGAYSGAGPAGSWHPSAGPYSTTTHAAPHAIKYGGAALGAQWTASDGASAGGAGAPMHASPALHWHWQSSHQAGGASVGSESGTAGSSAGQEGDDTMGRGHSGNSNSTASGAALATTTAAADPGAAGYGDLDDGTGRPMRLPALHTLPGGLYARNGPLSWAVAQFDDAYHRPLALAAAGDKGRGGGGRSGSQAAYDLEALAPLAIFGGEEDEANGKTAEDEDAGSAEHAQDGEDDDSEGAGTGSDQAAALAAVARGDAGPSTCSSTHASPVGTGDQANTALRCDSLSTARDVAEATPQAPAARGSNNAASGARETSPSSSAASNGSLSTALASGSIAFCRRLKHLRLTPKFPACMCHPHPQGHIWVEGYGSGYGAWGDGTGTGS